VGISHGRAHKGQDSEEGNSVEQGDVRQYCPWDLLVRLTGGEEDDYGEQHTDADSSEPEGRPYGVVVLPPPPRGVSGIG